MLCKCNTEIKIKKKCKITDFSKLINPEKGIINKWKGNNELQTVN